MYNFGRTPHRSSYLLAAVFVVLTAILFTTPWSILAQTNESERSYSYDRIEAQFNIQADSTVQVEEKTTFSFVGNFHSAWRNITLDKITAITDLEVLDGTTLLPLKPSAKRLDKLAPSSWGSYASWHSGGEQNIEWYYNLTDTKHTWILRYVVHGAIAFGDKQDRFYWNVFTDYDVPVNQASAQVILPQQVPATAIVAVAYTTREPEITGTYKETNGLAEFAAKNFAAGDDFTIDVGFPDGLVSRSAFWRDWLKLYWGYVLAALLVVLTVVTIALRWYVTEKRVTGRGTIIPQYEPPQKLKPAMAEIICQERLTNRGLAATVVDLAIRGYLKIGEDFGDNWFTKLGGKHYRLIKQRDFLSEAQLEDYERKYLGILFEAGGTFSTRAVKHWSDSKKRELHKSIQELKKSILGETEVDTAAYATKPSRENKAYTITLAVFIATVFLFFILPDFNLRQPLIALLALLLSSLIIGAFVKYEARLNEAGRILKEDWLGFKMFLAAAERYRLQNLTPETFAKFLPYAMIFGIEKKWARAFNSMHLPQPDWYAGAAGADLGSSSDGSFSASAFSASFSSSFASTFGSSGGAGGGGVGGGGGGGGGGAG